MSDDHNDLAWLPPEVQPVTRVASLEDIIGSIMLRDIGETKAPVDLCDYEIIKADMDHLEDDDPVTMATVEQLRPMIDKLAAAGLNPELITRLRHLVSPEGVAETLARISSDPAFIARGMAVSQSLDEMSYLDTVTTFMKMVFPAQLFRICRELRCREVARAASMLGLMNEPAESPIIERFMPVIVYGCGRGMKAEEVVTQIRKMPLASPPTT